MSFEALMSQAEAANAAGRWADLERLATAALKLKAGETRPKLLLGVALAQQRRPDQAIAWFQQVYSVSPNSVEALFWLSMLYRHARRPQESVGLAEKAVELAPSDANIISNLALSYMAASRLQEAEASFRRSASLDSSVAQTFQKLGQVLQLQSKDFEATAAFRRAVELDPRSVENLMGLSRVLLTQGEFEESIEYGRKALALAPNNPSIHLTLAGALLEFGKREEAERLVRKTAALNPSDGQTLSQLGMKFRSLGLVEEAGAAYEKAIRLQPDHPFAYGALLQSRKATEADRPLMAKMRELLKVPVLSPSALADLHYGLGKAHEDLKEYGPAMAHFDEANRVCFQTKFGGKPLDRDVYAKAVGWTIETFTPAFMERHKACGSDSDFPILVVGMMRSGTTLTEQILSSHPLVAAAGEQLFWTIHSPEVIHPDSPELKTSLLKQLGEEYVVDLRRFGPTAAHATDKMPGNYTYLGLIHLALPNARIIHVSRNPLDTCLSIYTTPNRAPNVFCHHKDNIVFGYEQYLRLMEHWHRVLPADRLLEVRYEELVSDTERVTRQMIDFCGLEWDDACLTPERNERSVVTPSASQVRQPVYNSSVDRWRKYEPWLEAFEKLRPLLSE